MENTRITVPLSDAVATTSPFGERERRAMGVLWAAMTLIGLKPRVSKTRTSPLCWRGGKEGVWVGVNVGEVELGCGKTR